MAEHFSQIKEVPDSEDEQNTGVQPASVSAYMWYLLAEKKAVPMLEQIEEGKKTIGLTMSPQQLAEAEDRAAAWLKTTKKHSGYANGGDIPTDDWRKGTASR